MHPPLQMPRVKATKFLLSARNTCRYSFMSSSCTAIKTTRAMTPCEGEWGGGGVLQSHLVSCERKRPLPKILNPPLVIRHQGGVLEDSHIYIHAYLAVSSIFICLRGVVQ